MARLTPTRKGGMGRTFGEATGSPGASPSSKGSARSPAGSRRSSGASRHARRLSVEDAPHAKNERNQHRREESFSGVPLTKEDGGREDAGGGVSGNAETAEEAEVDGQVAETY